jgi:signal transduction histidine kinase
MADMIKLRIKLALFNLLSKLVFTLLFLIILPYLIERISLLQIDNELIQKREKVITLISSVGIEPFITSDNGNAFGSYNILKEEFISLERIDLQEDANYIEVSQRLIEGENITYRVLNYSLKVDENTYLLEVGKSLSSIFNTQKNIKKVVLLFIVLIILLTFLTDLQYTRLLLRPLDLITNKLKGISNPSIFDKKPVKTTTSDFLHLDHALIELMGHIDQLFQKEKEITVNISHELLTPISVLRSKLENLLINMDSDSPITAKIEESLKTLHRLQSLVNSLLFIARIESQQYLLDNSFSLKEVLNDIISELNPIAEDAGILIKEELEKDFLIKKANKSLIFSMFYNVVNNAVKNTPAGGEVYVKSTSKNNSFIITIADTGKGMTNAQLSTLFSRFATRGENSNPGTGAGIGLAIAKTIADFHRIEISVDSIIQKGTSFSFTISENS